MINISHSYTGGNWSLEIVKTKYIAVWFQHVAENKVMWLRQAHTIFIETINKYLEPITYLTLGHNKITRQTQPLTLIEVT